MDTLTLVLFLIAIILLVIAYRPKKKPISEKMWLDAIAKKLGITEEDIRKAQEKTNMPKSKPQKTLTKSKFMKILKKAAQPISDWKHDQEETETSESHPSDDYTDKRKSQDKIEGAED